MTSNKYSVAIVGANNAIKDHMWREELRNKPHDIWEREHENQLQQMAEQCYTDESQEELE